jgi:hypothetical protein
MKFFFSNFSVFVRFVRFVGLFPPLFFCHQSPFKKFRFSSVASLDIISDKDSFDDLTTNPKLNSNFILGNTGVIQLDKVINIRRFKYSDHVYNLQTKDNYYLVNDPNIRKGNDNSKYIIAHNCHCSKLFNIKGL